MAMIQTDFFKPERIDILDEKIEKIHMTTENVRKGLFARHNELAKMYIELKGELENLKENFRNGN